MKKLANILIYLVLSLLTIWCTLALYFVPKEFQSLLAGAFLALICLSLFSKNHKKKLIFSLNALIICWHLGIKPSNERNWVPENKKIPQAIIHGDKITVKNIRDFAYKTEEDFTPHYYTREFDLSKLKSVDIALVYWGSKAIAHTMLSFGFDDDKYLTFSIETRKEVGEGYSALKGFFRNYELIYIAGDERDLIRLRSNFRKEDVYLYRLITPPARAQKILLDYLKKANSLNETPEFYNVLQDNCTTGLFQHFENINPALKFDYRVIVNGYLDEFIHELNGFKTSLPFDKYKKISLINDLALEANDSPEFSKIIRSRFNDK